MLYNKLPSPNENDAIVSILTLRFIYFFISDLAHMPRACDDFYGQNTFALRILFLGCDIFLFVFSFINGQYGVYNIKVIINSYTIICSTHTFSIVVPVLSY